MRQQLKTFAVLAITAAIAIKLFSFGLSYPLELRVRGDAHQYLSVANQFDSFSSVWNYAGLRSVGLPFLEFAIKQGLVTFTSANTFNAWVDAICISLLIIHMATAWFFAKWARQTKLIHSENGAFLLFAFLGTYPALIGHTTLPLTDTLAIDLVLCAVISLEAAFNARRTPSALMLSGLSAFLFEFSILVRPGSLAGVGVALAVAATISLFGERRKTWLIGLTVLGCLVTLTPFTSSCAQKYGLICLQSPQTVDFIASAQAGLAGGRTLWARGYTDSGVVNTVPDETMVSNYASRCRLTALLGITDTSLTGCLLSRPLAIPAYIGKKWIGLFDHFRFTPFLEDHTPFFLRWLSRAYDSLSWIGLALFFFSIVKMMKQETISGLKTLLAHNITPVLLTVYSMLMLAQHTIMHVEDRYGFPAIPLCATVLVIYGERAIRRYRSFEWRTDGPLVLYCCLAWAAFVTQIIIWDKTA